MEDKSIKLEVYNWIETIEDSIEQLQNYITNNYESIGTDYYAYIDYLENSKLSLQALSREYFSDLLS
jgi:hypothetical protein